MQRANLDWKRGFVGTGNESGERKTYDLTREREGFANEIANKFHLN